VQLEHDLSSEADLSRVLKKSHHIIEPDFAIWNQDQETPFVVPLGLGFETILMAGSGREQMCLWAEMNIAP